MSIADGQLTDQNIKELEQLYDLVVSDIEANPTMTWEDVVSLYPEGVLIQALRHADKFGAEDSARHHFIEWNNKRYLKQQWDDMRLHAEIQEMFMANQVEDYTAFMSTTDDETERIFVEGDELPW